VGESSERGRGSRRRRGRKRIEKKKQGTLSGLLVKGREKEISKKRETPKGLSCSDSAQHLQEEKIRSGGDREKGKRGEK